MMEAKDWLSFFVGLIVGSLGAIPLLEKYTALNWGISNFLNQNWFTAALPWIAGLAALYLIMDSFIEITNSNVVGWISIIVAFIALAAGALPILANYINLPFSVAFLDGSLLIYRIIFVIEGFFLMIAAFAMEM